MELAADVWLPAAPSGVPFLLVHGLASNARTWDGVAARLVARRPPDRQRGPARARAVVEAGRPVRRADRRRRPRRAHRGAGAGPAGRGRPVVGRQRRPGARRPPPGARAGDRLRRRRLAGAQPRVPRLGCLPRGARPTPAGRAPARRDRWVHPVGASRLAGERDPRHPGELRGPPRRHGRPVAHLRPPHRGAPRAVGAPSVRALPGPRRPGPARPGRRRRHGLDAAQAPGRRAGRWPRSRTPGSTGSPATTTSTRSARTNWQA